MNRFLIAAALCAATILPAHAQNLFAREQTAADQDDVYFIAQLKVDDMETFQSGYVPPVAQMLGKTSALVLAVTPTPQIVEGEWDSNWTVLMRFEDQADFDRFYKDPTYQDQFIPVRLGAASVNNVVILPAFDPAIFAQN